MLLWPQLSPSPTLGGAFGVSEAQGPAPGSEDTPAWAGRPLKASESTPGGDGRSRGLRLPCHLWPRPPGQRSSSEMLRGRGGEGQSDRRGPAGTGRQRGTVPLAERTPREVTGRSVSAPRCHSLRPGPLIPWPRGLAEPAELGERLQ